MQIVMARAGRKRTTRMHLSSPVQKIDYRALCGEQPHRRGLPVELRLSEKAETPFGCLNLMGVVTDEQYEAGRRYQTIVHEYGSSIGAPACDRIGGRGYACKGDARCGISEAGQSEATPCECYRRKVAYHAAFHALAPAGHKAQVQVARVAVHGRGHEPGSFEHLIRGLDLLVRHFGVGKRR